MDMRRIAGLLLIVAGLLALVYRGFSYTKESHEAKFGPLEFSVNEKETVAIPVWAGVGAVVAGTVVLLAGRQR